MIKKLILYLVLTEARRHGGRKEERKNRNEELGMRKVRLSFFFYPLFSFLFSLSSVPL
jgi:hypothetical protein